MGEGTEARLATLLADCHRDDSSAQQRLYLDWYAFARGRARPYGRNDEEVEEIVQDAFLKLFTSLRKSAFSGSFSGYFHRIVVNAGIDYYRRYQLRHPRSVGLTECPHHAAENTAPRQLEREDCIRLLQRLAPSYRIVFSLYVFEGLRHPEIARRMGISEGTSRSNLFKARHQLRTLVGPYLQIKNASPNG
jgi:RNA polymerase sigma-70 factor (ECF subfamily)